MARPDQTEADNRRSRRQHGLLSDLALKSPAFRCDPKEHVDGIGLRELLTAGKAPERDTLYWHYPHYHGGGCIPVGTMREGHYKIVHWLAKTAL